MNASRVRRRSLGLLAAAGFAITGVAATATGTTASADRSTTTDIKQSEHYITYAAPRVSPGADDSELVELGVPSRDAYETAQARGAAMHRKHMNGNPVTAKELKKLEREAIRTGKSPADIKGNRKWAKSTTEARLLTILVEFNPNANDDFTDSMVPEFWGATTCKEGNVQNGPLHNQIPDPATAGRPDNNSMWVPDFSPEHFNKMLYTDEGITERIRPDLTGPDGQPGIDISGYTMKNMYEEMSRGAYTVTGAATPWVQVPHSEGWYGATRCFQDVDEDGNPIWVAPAYQSMNGHPDNPLGPGQMAIDAVDQLVAQYPDFPLDDYDIEDQGDRDGDGNYHEPDGVIDHVVLVHAGADKSGGGGAETTYAIWAHSSSVAGGYDIPGTDLALSNYIVQPEDSGVGVFAHEYGHDLGLPDLYDTSGGGDSDVDFWDLMASGSHSGPIFQSMPTHMGIWDKWVLGWADPVEIDAGDPAKVHKLGQASRPKKGTKDGLKVNLPQKTIVLATPHSGETMWYSGADQNWADIRLSRTIDVPAAASVELAMWNDYVIEADWDFGFVELSTDGGATWTQEVVYDDAGTPVTTGDDYGDPNSRLSDYGGLVHGLTGSTNGWQRHHIDLTPYAGSTVQVRLRMATDAAFVERGWFADDFELVADGAVVWSDDAETDTGWVNTVETFTDTTGQGWRQHDGVNISDQFYMVEWRNTDGFDEGLKYAYDSTYLDTDTGAWKVEKLAYNAPGMLVWFRDAAYGETNHVTSDWFGGPSGGAKGGLLLVDSHFMPLARTGSAADVDPTTLNHMESRVQSSNAAFGLQPTSPVTECLEDANQVEHCTNVAPQAPVSQFTDDLGWIPGLAVDPEGGLYYNDIDASAVVPSVGNQEYSTRILHTDGTPATELYGLEVNGRELGSGNPADDGVGFGTVITLKKAMQANTAALVKVTPPTVD